MIKIVGSIGFVNSLPVALQITRRGEVITIGVITMTQLDAPDEGEWNEVSISCWAVIAAFIALGIVIFAIGGLVAMALGG